MATVESRPPVQPGEPAPDFTLPAVEREGTVSLADYRGKSALLLAVFRGAFCTFCRRAIAQMSLIRGKVLGVGVEALGIIATSPENARLYFRFHPTRLPLAADPELITHRSYGIPTMVQYLTPTQELLHTLQSVRINPTGELPEPLPVEEAVHILDRMDGFKPTEVDRQDGERHWTQLIGQFLIDRHGIVRWANIECAKEGLGGLGKFPTDEELLAAVQTLKG